MCLCNFINNLTRQLIILQMSSQVYMSSNIARRSLQSIPTCSRIPTWRREAIAYPMPRGRATTRGASSDVTINVTSQIKRQPQGLFKARISPQSNKERRVFVLSCVLWLSCPISHGNSLRSSGMYFLSVIIRNFIRHLTVISNDVGEFQLRILEETTQSIPMHLPQLEDNLIPPRSASVSIINNLRLDSNLIFNYLLTLTDYLTAFMTKMNRNDRRLASIQNYPPEPLDIVN